MPYHPFNLSQACPSSVPCQEDGGGAGFSSSMMYSAGVPGATLGIEFWGKIDSSFFDPEVNPIFNWAGCSETFGCVAEYPAAACNLNLGSIVRGRLYQDAPSNLARLTLQCEEEEETIDYV